MLRREVKAGEGEHVWLAHDEILGKDISLHFIPEALRSDERGMSELRSEIKRNRQLIHPGVLRVYDLVEESGWSAISMDWFDGESLASLLKKSPGGLGVAELSPVVRQACRTLDDVHKIQVVHRNLTPANLFVDAAGKVLVARFGISRVIEDALGRARKASGGTDDSLAYVSPQQLDGETPTRLDDLYSLGATLFELLTGQLPFSGADLFTQIRRTPAPSVSERRHKAGGAGVPPSWEKAVAACLAKAPTDRPQSAGAVAQQLELSDKGAAEVTPAAIGTAIAAGAAVAAVTREKPAPEPAPVEKQAAPEPDEPVAGKEEPAHSSPEHDPTLPPPVERGRRSRHEPEDETGASEIYPDLYKRPGMAGGTIALLAALVIGVIACLVYFSRQADSSGSHAPTIANQPQAAPKPTPAKPAPATPAAASTVAANPGSPEANPGLLGEPRLDDPAAAGREPSANRARPSTGTAAADSHAPATPAAVKAPEQPQEEQVFFPALEKASPAEIAAQLAAAQKARTDAEAALQASQKKKQTAEAALAQAQKGVDDKAKAIAPVLKAADDLQAERQKRADDAKAAEDAARDAHKAVEEATRAADLKARQAEDTKKSLADWEKQNSAKLAGRDKAQTEYQALQNALAEKLKDTTDAAKSALDADASRTHQIAAIKTLTTLASQAQAREAAEAQRKADEENRNRQAQMRKEIEDMKKQLDERMRILDAMSQGSAKPVPTAPVATPAPPVATPVPVAPPTPAPRPATPVPAPATPVAVAPPVATPIVVVVRTTPPPMVAPPVATPAPPVPVETAAADKGSENSLGQKFAAVGDVQFCVWPTRLQDFEAFAQEANVKSGGWRTPGFKQGPLHPVVNVSWIDAMAFCKWLTDREHKKGLLAKDLYYRLPTDLEWSKGVGLPDEPGKTPADRDMGVPDVFPWGTQWPPPPNVGNYTGEETGSDVAIRGYDDGFAWTSPVGSFPPNKLGLYDMGGNVWQWCMDSWTPESKAKVLRGASWYNGALKLSLLSSCRVHANPDSSTDNYGFRIVKAQIARR